MPRKGDFKDPFLKFCAGIELQINGCWLWTGGQTLGGYGTINVYGKTMTAHKWSYQHFKGRVPEGLHLDHICRVRNCANPNHLRAVTPLENVMCGIGIAVKNKAKTHCLRGHEFNEENTLLGLRNGRKIRWCRACQKIRTQKHLNRLVG